MIFDILWGCSFFCNASVIISLEEKGNQEIYSIDCLNVFKNKFFISKI